MLRVLLGFIVGILPGAVMAGAWQAGSGPAAPLDPVVAAPAASGEVAPVLERGRVSLGFARIFDNDVIGDGRDRWRTGSYQISNFRGYYWNGTRPARPGELLEFRLRGEIIAPANLTNPNPLDRRYAETLSFGVRSHSQFRGNDLSMGIDLVMIGPQTHILKYQRALHKIFGQPLPNVRATEIGDAIRPTAQIELGREFQLGGARLRPFVEAQAGAETLARVGFDATIGEFGRQGLRIRDVVTGQRMPGITGGEGRGASFLFGGDLAYVADSVYLPESLGYQARSTRGRLRAGLYYEGDRASIFYGWTYLTREFERQPEGQAVGSLTLRLAF